MADGAPKGAISMYRSDLVVGTVRSIIRTETDGRGERFPLTELLRVGQLLQLAVPGRSVELQATVRGRIDRGA